MNEKFSMEEEFGEQVMEMKSPIRTESGFDGVITTSIVFPE